MSHKLLPAILRFKGTNNESQEKLENRNFLDFSVRYDKERVENLNKQDNAN